MTPIVWANILLAVVFVAAFAGVPLWMTLRRPDRSADHTAAHAYLAHKSARNAALAAAPAAPSAPAAPAGLRPVVGGTVAQPAGQGRHPASRSAGRTAGPAVPVHS